MASLGTYMRNERELRDLSLAEIAQTTRIPVRVLINLESDAEAEFPAEVFVRGYLRAYARAVGIPVDELLARFQRGASYSDSRPPAPLASLPPSDSGHRFGMAIALVILLILFTLALSIVLRPRRRDTPVQLSQWAPLQLEQVQVAAVGRPVLDREATAGARQVAVSPT